MVFAGIFRSLSLRGLTGGLCIRTQEQRKAAAAAPMRIWPVPILSLIHISQSSKCQAQLPSLGSAASRKELGTQLGLHARGCQGTRALGVESGEPGAREGDQFRIYHGRARCRRQAAQRTEDALRRPGSSQSPIARRPSKPFPGTAVLLSCLNRSAPPGYSS